MKMSILNQGEKVTKYLSYLCICGSEVDEEYNYYSVHIPPAPDHEHNDLIQVQCLNCKKLTNVHIKYDSYQFDYEAEGAISKADPLYKYWESFLSIKYSFFELKNLVETKNKEQSFSLNRLFFTHCITIFETYLSDTLKFFVLENKAYFLKFIQNSKNLREEKFTLEEFIIKPDLAINRVEKRLNEIVYHNLPVSFSLYKQVLNVDIDSFIGKENRKNLEVLINLRHDCIHRNGSTKDGANVVVDPLDLIDVIQQFTNIVDFIHNDLLYKIIDDTSKTQAGFKKS